MFEGVSTRRLVIGRVIAAALVIAAGLALRRFGYDLGLPFVVVKYGGSVLWGAMVYLLLGAILGRSRREMILVGAIFISIGIELFRLYHTPWLNEFRLTTPGALLLGRVFSPWNIVAYVFGIGTAALTERLITGSRKR